MKTIYVLIILCLGRSKKFAQNALFLPYSSNTASVGQNSTPLVYYTGLLAVDIPLSNIISGYISRPINLRIHASGIKKAIEARTFTY